MGGIVMDETGDRTTMEETFNLYEGFSLSSLYLNAHRNPGNHLLLDLTDINLDDRRGNLEYRQSGLLRFRSRYDQSRFLYDPAGSVDSRRRDWLSSLLVTPAKFRAEYMGRNFGNYSMFIGQGRIKADTCFKYGVDAIA